MDVAVAVGLGDRDRQQVLNVRCSDRTKDFYLFTVPTPPPIHQRLLKTGFQKHSSHPNLSLS